MDNDLALKIYIKARATPKVVAAFAERREFDKILIYSKQVSATYMLFGIPIFCLQISLVSPMPGILGHRGIVTFSCVSLCYFFCLAGQQDSVIINSYKLSNRIGLSFVGVFMLL